VVADPAGPTAAAFMELGAAVVQEVAKLKLVPRSAVRSVASPHSVATAVREAARRYMHNATAQRAVCTVSYRTQPHRVDRIVHRRSLYRDKGRTVGAGMTRNSLPSR